MAPYRMDALAMEELSNPARGTDRRIVTFPDYSRADPYTEMLYSRLRTLPRLLMFEIGRRTWPWRRSMGRCT